MKKIFVTGLLLACTPEKPSIDPVPAPLPEAQEEVSEPYEYANTSVAVVNFDFDKIVLSNVEKKKIYDQVWKNRKPSTPVKIIGYTDSQGPDDYNQKLSKLRADSVAVHLMGLGIGKRWLEPEGKGETNLLNKDRTLGEHFANRRAEITYIVK